MKNQAVRPFCCTGCSAPGATRTPNLLIRRSPSRVHGCPQESMLLGTEGLRFHRRPQPSAAIHREWLPTWLPARAPTNSTIKAGFRGPTWAGLHRWTQIDYPTCWVRASALSWLSGTTACEADSSDHRPQPEEDRDRESSRDTCEVMTGPGSPGKMTIPTSTTCAKSTSSGMPAAWREASVGMTIGVSATSGAP